MIAREQGMQNARAAGAAVAMEARKRNCAVAQRMHKRGQSAEDIAAVLQVCLRTVRRYLADDPVELLPAPKQIQLTDFYMQGACFGRTDIEWAVTDSRTQIAAAKQVCAGCPVIAKCQTYGLTTGKADHGIWGGLTRNERREAAGRRLLSVDSDGGAGQESAA